MKIDSSSAADQPTLRWYRLSPDRMVVGLLAVEGFLVLAALPSGYGTLPDSSAFCCLRRSLAMFIPTRVMVIAVVAKPIQNRDWMIMFSLDVR